MNKMLRYVLASFGLSFLAGAIGVFVNIQAIPNWYATLTKPSFNPPNWVFGPVWTVLYFLMGLSLYLVLKTKHNKKKEQAVTIFYIQLLFNTVWSILFFGLKMPAVAFGEIIMMWCFILLTIIYFYPIKKISSYLLIPYLAWVSFASVLNFMIIVLN